MQGEKSNKITLSVLGEDDKFGENYTGQEAVLSFYEY
jgi:hypothetical protein